MGGEGSFPMSSSWLPPPEVELPSQGYMYVLQHTSNVHFSHRTFLSDLETALKQ